MSILRAQINTDRPADDVLNRLMAEFKGAGLQVQTLRVHPDTAGVITDEYGAELASRGVTVVHDASIPADEIRLSTNNHMEV